MAIIKGRVQAAEALGIAPATLREWMALPGFPDTSEGHDLEAIRAWRNAYGKKGSSSDNTLSRLKTAYEAERVRQAQISTKRMGIVLQKLEGSLLRRTSAELVLSTTLRQISDDFLQITHTFPANSGVPTKFHAVMRKRIKEELAACLARTEHACQEALRQLAELAQDDG